MERPRGNSRLPTKEAQAQAFRRDEAALTAPRGETRRVRAARLRAASANCPRGVLDPSPRCEAPSERQETSGALNENFLFALFRARRGAGAGRMRQRLRRRRRGHRLRPAQHRRPRIRRRRSLRPARARRRPADGALRTGSRAMLRRHRVRERQRVSRGRVLRAAERVVRERCGMLRRRRLHDRTVLSALGRAL